MPRYKKRKVTSENGSKVVRRVDKSFYEEKSGKSKAKIKKIYKDPADDKIKKIKSKSVLDLSNPTPEAGILKRRKIKRKELKGPFAEFRLKRWNKKWGA